MPSLFFSYSHADEALRDQLEKQLAMLKRQGVIETWHDRRIGAGTDWATQIDDHVETDDIILLLVSPDFLASDYCYEKEMRRAVERHDAGEAVVIPVILRPCDWQGAPFGKLQALPKDGKPVTLLPDIDAALLEVALGVRGAAERLNATIGSLSHERADVEPSSSAHRSSNLRLRKTFTDRDKDLFRLEVFEYLARFFENSLGELGKRNAGVEGAYRRVDANRFTAAVYRNGETQARCTVFLSSGGFGQAGAVCYADGETSDSNSFNEQLTVEEDDQALFLRPLGIAFMGGERDSKLSLEGAAELYWAMFIRPLQI